MKRVVQILSILMLTHSPAGADEWYRGNTHAHTELCGHADSTPEAVARWYHDHGYHFLILSEHNQFINPDEVNLPENRREDFILIPGEEVTGKRTIHTTAMNIDHLVPWEFDHEEKWKIIQNHVDGIQEAAGVPILNHPNFKFAVGTGDMLPVKRLHMFELYNGHPATYNLGDHDHPSTEEMWDTLLTEGMLIYGVASDDAHHLKTVEPGASNPGRGWVMVQSPGLSPGEITKAMADGNFYSSSGVFLKRCSVDSGEYVVEVDEERTRAELASSVTVRAAFVHEGREGYRIEFIGPDGEVVSTVDGTTAVHELDSSVPYVRARVTLTRMYPEHGYEQYFAWGQPAFMVGR